MVMHYSKSYLRKELQFNKTFILKIEKKNDQSYKL